MYVCSTISPLPELINDEETTVVMDGNQTTESIIIQMWNTRTIPANLIGDCAGHIQGSLDSLMQMWSDVLFGRIQESGKFKHSEITREWSTKEIDNFAKIDYLTDQYLDDLEDDDTTNE